MIQVLFCKLRFVYMCACVCTWKAQVFFKLPLLLLTVHTITLNPFSSLNQLRPFSMFESEMESQALWHEDWHPAWLSSGQCKTFALCQGCNRSECPDITSGHAKISCMLVSLSTCWLSERAPGRRLTDRISITALRMECPGKQQTQTYPPCSRGHVPGHHSHIEWQLVEGAASWPRLLLATQRQAVRAHP
jgi:hypothetical protein